MNVYSQISLARLDQEGIARTADGRRFEPSQRVRVRTRRQSLRNRT